MELASAAPFPMWGVGFTSQTNLYPFGYPLSLPTTSVEGANPKNNMQTANYVATVGAKFVGYLNPQLRGAIRPIYSFGSAQSGYSAIGASLEVDQIFSDYNGIQVFAGGGIGTGGFQFDQGDSGVLSGRNLYLRGHGGAFMGSGKSAWELALFAELGFVGEERYQFEGNSYTNGGFFNKDETASLGWGVYYPIIGVEFSGYFGQFGGMKTRTKRKKARKRRRR
jgi:hypothetical protein